MASHTWYLPALTGFAAGSYGSAMVHGSHPLVAMALRKQKSAPATAASAPLFRPMGIR